jgi:hypothetical protein
MLKPTTRKQSRPRGMAMLLVLISLMVATVLTTAYVASRDNSGVIGRNIASAAQSRWLAESGLELGVAVLETDCEWRTQHVNGKLLDDYLLNDGMIDIDMIDLATNLPPTSSTEDVELTCIGMVNGVQQIATATAHVPLEDGGAVDIDLSEFAVFGKDKISMANTATVTRWPEASLSALGRRVAIGTDATAPSSVSVQNSAAFMDTTLYHGPGVSSSLVSIANATRLEKRGFADFIPMPLAPDSGVGIVLPLAPFKLVAGTSTVSANRAYTRFELDNATLTSNGTMNLVSSSDIILTKNAKLVVNGNLTMVAGQNLVVDTSSIELGPTGKLILYAGNTLTLTDGYIGDQRSTSVRDNTGGASWMDPDRVQIFRTPTLLGATTTWTMDKNSVAKANVYAPKVKFQMKNQSALYGRVAAQEVSLIDEAAVFYDHSLDSQIGYTASDSPLVDATGHIDGLFRALANFDLVSLLGVANLTGKIIKSPKGRDQPSILPAVLPTVTPPVVGADDPTPRTKTVSRTLTDYGSEREWEEDNSGPGGGDDD